VIFNTTTSVISVENKIILIFFSFLIYKVVPGDEFLRTLLICSQGLPKTMDMVNSGITAEMQYKWKYDQRPQKPGDQETHISEHSL
jgi:hypothetical protein